MDSPSLARSRQRSHAWLVGLAFVPMLALALYSYSELYGGMTRAVYDRCQSVSELAALILEEKFDRLKDVASSLATRKHFLKVTDAGDWASAIAIIRHVPDDFPYVERVFLADANGTLMAQYPELAGSVGKNFAHRDWYQGARRTGDIYVSKIYKRSAEPQYNVIALAAPLKPDGVRTAGYLVLQIRLGTFVEWSSEIRKKMSSGASLYFTDPDGNVAGHSKFEDTGPIVNFSEVTPVKKALLGLNGVEPSFTNPLVDDALRVAGYTPVPRYGWTAILSEPRTEAFALRTHSLALLGALYGTLVALSGALVAVAVRNHQRLLKSEREMSLVKAEREQLELFAFVASHDLQEPLQKIVSFGELLRASANAKLNDQERHYFDRIQAACARMRQMMEDLKKYSRTRSAELKSVRLEDVVDASVRELEGSLRDAGAVVEWKDLPQVVGDETQLKHLFHNLLENSIKYRGAAPLKIIIESRPVDKNRFELVVTDNGVGFDPQYSETIFTPFKRLHTQSQVPGSGMGLAICRKIVALHGGTIRAESERGRGSTFVISLPYRVK